MIELIVELIVQIFGEVILQGGSTSVVEAIRAEPRSKLVAGIGQALLGLVFGALSLMLWPTLYAHSRAGRIALLVVTPLAVAAVLWQIARWRGGRDPWVAFQRGLIFALAMNLVRFQFGD